MTWALGNVNICHIQPSKFPISTFHMYVGTLKVTRSGRHSRKSSQTERGSPKIRLKKVQRFKLYVQEMTLPWHIYHIYHIYHNLQPNIFRRIPRRCSKLQGLCGGSIWGKEAWFFSFTLMSNQPPPHMLPIAFVGSGTIGDRQGAPFPHHSQSPT